MIGTSVMKELNWLTNMVVLTSTEKATKKPTVQDLISYDITTHPFYFSLNTYSFKINNLYDNMSIWHNMSLAIIQLSELLPIKTNRKIEKSQL